MLRASFRGSRRIRLIGAGVLATLAVAGSTAAQSDYEARGVEVVALYDPTGGPYMDVWGYTAPDGTELAILAAYDAVVFVDVTNPASPRTVLHFFAIPSTHRDMRTWGTYAYSVNEEDGGMQIFDLSNPRKPQWVGAFDATFQRGHNIGIYDGWAYIAGASHNNHPAGMRILDLADPVRPVEVGAYTERYVHDIFVRDDIAYASNIGNNVLTVLDVSDKSQPVELAVLQTGHATHQAWLTDDGRHLLTAHESVGGQLRIWNIEDLQQLRRVATVRPHPESIIHNVFVRGDTAYASWYAEGLQVIDLTDIEASQRVSWLDTRPAFAEGFQGVWGVYPFARSGLVYCSDMARGLYVLRLTPAIEPQSNIRIQAPASKQAVPGDAELEFDFDVANHGSLDEELQVEATNTAGWPVQHVPVLRVRQTGSEIVRVVVQVPGDLDAATVVDVELCLTSMQTTDRGCANSSPQTPVTLQDMRVAWVDASGVHLTWRLAAVDEDGAALWVLRRTHEDTDWQRRARLDLEVGGWIDPDVEAGRRYEYALALDRGNGVSILGTRWVVAGAPAALRALGNWPNPFNPQTRVRFALGKRTSVWLEIHDSRGTFVRRIERHDLAPGTHAIDWDGRDARQVPLPSGVYYYELRSPPWKASGRMTLVR